MVLEVRVAESEEVPSTTLSEVELPNETMKLLGSSAKNAFSLESLHKTFALELIECVLTNYHELFCKHEELILLLQHYLCPLLLKTLSDRPQFHLSLRCTHVVFLLLKKFSLELRTEGEVFLSMLIRIISEDSSDSADQARHIHSVKPLWMQVLIMEIMRGLCSHAELIRNMWDCYNAQATCSKPVTSLITAPKRLVTEKLALLGVCQQTGGVGVQAEPSATSTATGAAGAAAYGLDMARRVASATVSGVVVMISGGTGLSLQGSAMKLQCIDELDKADAPPVPEAYIYLLAVQCIISLCEGFASFSGPTYTSIAIQRPRAAGDAAVRAPPALDLDTLPPNDQTHHLRIVQFIISQAWPALLAALSFIISTNLSDELFVEVLASYHSLTNVSGMLGLTTPIDTFFNSPCGGRAWTRWADAAVWFVREKYGMFEGPTGLCALLAGSLGESWYAVLESTAECRDGLGYDGQDWSAGAPASRSASSSAVSGSQAGSGTGAMAVKHPVLTDLEVEIMQTAVRRLFDSSKDLEDLAFKDFVQAQYGDEDAGVGSGGLLSVSKRSQDNVVHRRRVSGIFIPENVRSGSINFAISKLGGVAILNIHRLIDRSPDIAWDAVTDHVLMVMKLPFASQPIRIQAAKVLVEILLVVPCNLSSTGELQAQVQRSVIDVPAQQVIPDLGSPLHSADEHHCRAEADGSGDVASDIASCRTHPCGWMGNHIPDAGQCLPTSNWDLFDDLSASSAYKIQVDSVSVLSVQSSPVTRTKPLPLGLGKPSEKSYNTLVKIASQPLMLAFRHQADPNVTLTAAASLLWSVSDAIQSKRKNVSAPTPERRSEMVLSRRRSGPRSFMEPRSARIHGNSASGRSHSAAGSLAREIRQLTDPNRVNEEGIECAWDDSKTLALQSIGSIFSNFLVEKIMLLDSFTKVRDVLMDHIEEAVLIDNRSVSSPALRCLEKAIKTLASAEAILRVRATDHESLEGVWKGIDLLGTYATRMYSSQDDLENSPHQPSTQESLVAYLDVIQPARMVSRDVDGKERNLKRLTRMMVILKDDLLSISRFYNLVSSLMTLFLP
ncbi:hypothetical protein CVT26_005212 [Gymnopilus dilepis]|uniref:Mon2/Sec7/BIG1-like HUS domain-containing protein n=1 Tax=Gymnopilus dilepis TaxID=231916 RepID=A0A409YVF7_9AGAR|nr:hypothetical protein CVT26_005212 [Gymnopilus dilepis]